MSQSSTTLEERLAVFLATTILNYKRGWDDASKNRYDDGVIRTKPLVSLNLTDNPRGDAYNHGFRDCVTSREN